MTPCSALAEVVQSLPRELVDLGARPLEREHQEQSARPSDSGDGGDKERSMVAGGGDCICGAAQGAGARDDRSVPLRARAVEAVYEGHRVHAAKSRVFARSLDADLALLAGDALYAQALSELAEHRDLEAIDRLAACIAEAAHGRAVGRGECDLHALFAATATQLLSAHGGPR